MNVFSKKYVEYNVLFNGRFVYAFVTEPCEFSCFECKKKINKKNV